MSGPVAPPSNGAAEAGYRLDDQVGFLLRQVQQRHTTIFAEAFGDGTTPLQWAAVSKLAEIGESSQNQLGRMVATDVATIKGVAERLLRRGFITTRPDPTDRRRVLLSLSDAGIEFHRAACPVATRISNETLTPLAPGERRTLLSLLGRMR